MDKPTQEQIWEEELGEPIYVDSQPQRWGERRIEVYLWEREGHCDTYWRVQYNIQNDGDYNELRDNENFILVQEVIPYEITTTKYKPVAEILNSEL